MTSSGDATTRGLIASIECFPVRLPMRKPLEMASGRLVDAPILLVRISTRCGAEGWGEAAASLGNAGDTLPGMVSLVDQAIAPRLLGRTAHDRAELSAGLRDAIHGNGGAICAIDMALLDLVGHLHDVPLVDLLGGAIRKQVQTVSIIGGSGDASIDAREAADHHRSGARAFKLKVGLAGVDADIRSLAAVREAVGSDCLISADANMAWSPARAIAFARAALEHDLSFIEQPVPADPARLRMVARSSPIAIGVDESVHGREDVMTLARLEAIAGVSLKAIKLGGITPTSNLAIVSDALGLSVGLAMMMESSLATAAMVHLGCAVPQIDWGLNLGNGFLAEDPVDRPVHAAAGHASPHRGAGIGVRVDLERLAPFSIA